MVPGVFAADGCGEGTVLVDGVCQLASVESSGCGEGTVLEGNTCVLVDEPPSESSHIEQCHVGTVMINGVCEGIVSILGVVAIISAFIGIIFFVMRRTSGSKTSKSTKQDLEEYEEKYLAKQKPSPKPAKKKETSSSCNNCGKPLKPEAKFCGQCGTSRS